MRVEVLSDHVGERYRRVELDVADNQVRIAGHFEQLRQAKLDLRSVRRRKGILKRLFRIRTTDERQALRVIEGIHHSIGLAYRRHGELERSRLKLAGGLEGESTLRRELSRLPDDWVCLSGYKNRSGEVDAILVGPHGIWAVEVKYQRAHLHVDGDEWWFDKYDRYGNIVEQQAAVDGSGRSWGRQVSDPAGRLASWLARNGHNARVRTAVVLANPRASLGRIRGQGIDLITCNPKDLVGRRNPKKGGISSAEVEAIVELIRRDHRHHQQQRRTRR